MKKAILRLAAIGALLFMGNTPYKTLRFDIQDNGKPLELKYLYEGSTPLIRGQLYQGGSTWSPTTNWGGFMWYGTNYLESTSIVKVQGVVYTNGYIDFQFSNNDTATNGSFLGGMTMTNATQTITWNHLTIQLQKDPGSQAGTLHLINLPTGTGHGQLAWYNTNISAWTTLNIGTEGYRLAVDSGIPAWVAGGAETAITNVYFNLGSSNHAAKVGRQGYFVFDTNKYTRGEVDNLLALYCTLSTFNNHTNATGTAVHGLGTMSTRSTNDFSTVTDFGVHTGATGTAVHGLGSISTRGSNDFTTASTHAGHTNATGTSVHGLGTIATRSSNDFTTAATHDGHTNATGASVHGLGTISTRSSNDFATATEFAGHTNANGTAVHGLGTIATRSSNDFSTASEFAGHTNATGSSVHGLGTVSTLSSNIFVLTNETRDISLGGALSLQEGNSQLKIANTTADQIVIGDAGRGTNSIIFGFEALAGFPADVAGKEGIVAMGYRAGKNVTNSPYASFIGHQAGLNATNSPYAVMHGRDAGANAWNSGYASLIGHQAGMNANDSFGMVAEGYQAGLNANNSPYGVMKGYQAGLGAYSSPYCSIVGYQAGAVMNNSPAAILQGKWAGFWASGVTNSIMLGVSAGYNATGAYECIFIGTEAGMGNQRPYTYILDSDTNFSHGTNAFLYGEMDNRLLRVSGHLTVTGTVTATDFVRPGTAFVYTNTAGYTDVTHKVAVMWTGKTDLVAFNGTNQIFEGRIATVETGKVAKVGDSLTGNLIWNYGVLGVNGASRFGIFNQYTNGGFCVDSSGSYIQGTNGNVVLTVKNKGVEMIPLSLNGVIYGFVGIDGSDWVGLYDAETQAVVKASNIARYLTDKDGNIVADYSTTGTCSLTGYWNITQDATNGQHAMSYQATTGYVGSLAIVYTNTEAYTDAVYKADNAALTNTANTYGAYQQDFRAATVLIANATETNQPVTKSQLDSALVGNQDVFLSATKTTAFTNDFGPTGYTYLGYSEVSSIPSPATLTIPSLTNNAYLFAFGDTNNAYTRLDGQFVNGVIWISENEAGTVIGKVEIYRRDRATGALSEWGTGGDVFTVTDSAAPIRVPFSVPVVGVTTNAFEIWGRFLRTAGTASGKNIIVGVGTGQVTRITFSVPNDVVLDGYIHTIAVTTTNSETPAVSEASHVATLYWPTNHTLARVLAAGANGNGGTASNFVLGAGVDIGNGTNLNFYHTWHLYPTTAVYHLSWDGPFEETRTLVSVFAKTDASTCTVSVIEHSSNMLWATYTTNNASIIALTNGVHDTSWDDASVAIGNELGIKIENHDATCKNLKVIIKSRSAD